MKTESKPHMEKYKKKLSMVYYLLKTLNIGLFIFIKLNVIHIIIKYE